MAHGGGVVSLSLEKVNYSHLTKGALRRIKENFGKLARCKVTGVSEGSDEHQSVDG